MRTDGRKGVLQRDDVAGRVELRGLSKRYGERLLIDDLSLVLERGERLGMIGPNGVGKTTLVRILLGE